MRAGLLWFDDSSQVGLEDKVGRAALRYREKFGRVPDVCYLNPQTLNPVGQDEREATCRVESLRTTIRLVPAGYILKCHFLLAENGQGQ